MALSPLQASTYERVEIVEAETQPALTYEFDFVNGEFTGKLIDDTDAIHQFIHKAIGTARNKFLIYDDQYGSEIDELIAESLPYEMLQVELERVIKEALIYDDRIASVSDFAFTRTADKLFVTFNVTTNQGEVIGEEVVI